MTSDTSQEGVCETEAAFDHEVDLSPYDTRAEAIARARGMGEDEIAMIKAGLEDVRAGRTVPHEELMARVAAKHGW